MRDLLVVVPSRGRPQQLKAMLDAARGLAQAETDFAVAVDSDDPARPEYEDWLLPLSRSGPGVRYYTGPRDTLAGWTNSIALKHAGQGAYGAFASLGDDHFPRTEGWDRELLAAVAGMGGTGIAYGADGIMETLPTAPVISADIVTALGWMCLPGLAHYCVDNVWGDLGRAAGCLVRCPDVLVEHLHPAAGKGTWDGTYADAGGFREGCPDHEGYLRWQAERMDADIATVKALMA